jgi:17 kDa outer membrane surface antigen
MPVLFAALTLCATRVAAPTTNLSFLANSPVFHFTAEDTRLLRAAALSLLVQGDVGATREWRNPDTTASGTLKITKAFESTEGFRCEVLRVENSAAGVQGRASHTVCEIHPGEWKLHPDAKPKPAEKKPESPAQ